MNARPSCRLHLLLALLLAVCTAAICTHGYAQSSVSAPHLKVSLISDTASVSPNQTPAPHVGLLFDLESGWHVYWTNAGDSGEPPSVKWVLPAGVTAGPLQFPAPKRLPLGPLMDFGYEDQVLLPAELHVAAEANPKSAIPVGADVNWLVCRQACIPGKAHLALNLPAGPGGPSTAAPLFAKTFAAMPKELPGSAKAIYSYQPDGLHLAVLTGHSVKGAQFFPAEQSVIANAAPQTVTPRSDGAVITLKKDENLQSAPAALSGILVLLDGTSYLVRAAQGAVPAETARQVQRGCDMRGSHCWAASS